jgi:hypothetical protein
MQLSDPMKERGKSTQMKPFQPRGSHFETFANLGISFLHTNQLLWQHKFCISYTDSF